MPEQQNPFELQPQLWGGMPSLMQQGGEVGGMPQGPYGGLQPGPGGSYFQLSPEAMQKMWAPQPPQINPMV